MAHPFSDFVKYANTPLQRDILPIIPARDAVGNPTTLRPTSKLTADHLGKIPGIYYDDGWTGFAWQNNRATATMLQRWNEWQGKTETAIAIALNTADVHGADIDIDDPVIAEQARMILAMYLGDSPVVRRRNGSTRFVMFYKHKDHTAPIRKFRIAFVDKQGKKHAVEFLAVGQQVVIEGPHAKGEMHYWESLGLIEGYDKLPEVTVEMVNAAFNALRQWVEAEGFTLDKIALRGGSSSDAAASVSISNLMSPHLARDVDMLTQALDHIELDDPKIDYDTFVNLLRAICAAVGGDLIYMAEVVWPWVCAKQTIAHGAGPRTEERGIEWLEERWRSFTDSQLGADYVFGWAASFGWAEGMRASTTARLQEIFPNALPDDTTDGGADPGADQAGAGGSQQPGGAGGAAPPGGGPIPFNDTHSAVADAFEAVFTEDRRFLVDTKQWLGFTPAGIWEQRHALLHDIETVTKGIAQQILATVAGSNGVQRNRALLSTGTNLSVRTLLQSRPAMITTNDDFDADPRLLNTPGFVFNLETGETYEHSAQFKMRQQTLLTPDCAAYGAYPRYAPRFMRFLEIIADGRDWVIPFLQRWFGYCLTGKIGHQHFLFLQGLPGTGKSQLITILLKLMHSYAVLLREGFMTKGQEKRFDMVKIVGKRLGFNDETMLGSTWDETRMTNVAGAEKLSAEIKGGIEFDFTNQVKLIVAGNHRPNFVSGEAGGLLRRMLLLEMTHKPVIHTLKVEENFAERLVEAEGAAIMMWAIEGAMLDYADTDNLIFDGLKQPMVDAAKAYTRENSAFWGWADEHCTRGPGQDMDFLEAYRHFQDHVWNTTHERCRVRRTDFKAALKAMMPELEFAVRTTRPHPNRAFVKGLGFTKVNWEEAGNVVDINNARSAEGRRRRC